MRAASAADTISACVSRIAAAGGFELKETCDEEEDEEDAVDVEEDDEAEEAEVDTEKAEEEEEEEEEEEAEDRRQKPPCASNGRSSGTSECANSESERLREERAAALRCTVECCSDEGDESPKQGA